MTRLALIYNPDAGLHRDPARSIQRMVDALRRRGISTEAHRTVAPGDAARLSQVAIEAGAPMIVVRGGDGTVNEAMQPLVGTRIPLAVWPGGTANVLATEQRLPRDVDRVADMISAGRVRRVSVGRAGPRYFLLVAGVGLDATLVRTVRPELKRLTGQGAYWVAGLRQLVHWHPRRFAVEVDGRRFEATFAVLANAASYAAGLRFAPRASMVNEVLDLCLFAWHRRRDFLRHFFALRSGSHLGLPGVTYLEARRATAHGDDETWVQVDGDLLGHLPMTFECVPAALSLVVP
jgi:diacylglycerol kinase (ATP)